MSSFCLGCGNSMTEGERFCGICGKDSAGPAAPAVDPGVAFGLPPETSGKAIFSLVCGILFLILPFSLAAVIFGHLSLSEIRRSAGRLAGKGLAITGLVLGYVGVALILVLIIAGISAQRSARMARVTQRKENPAVTGVRTLNTAEIAYAQAHPAVGYTCSLSDLSGAWGIGNELARGEKSGYVFKVQGCRPAKSNGPLAMYQIVAYSAGANQGGTPAFCSKQSDRIRVAQNGSPEDCLSSGADWLGTEIDQQRGGVKMSPR